MQPSADIPTLPDRWKKLDGHFRDGRDIFTVYQGDQNFMSNMPSRDEAPAPTFDRKDGEFRHTTWTSASLPYLIFVPRYDPFRGRMFERLNHTKKTLPLLHSEGGWHLAKHVQDSWYELEKSLRSMLTYTYNKYPGCVVEGMIPFPSPNRFGYKSKRKPSREDAAIIAMRSRNAFLPLMANITMMFLLLDTRYPPSWRQSVISETSIAHQWLTELEESTVGDMEIERLGGIIDFAPELPPECARRHTMEQLFQCVVEKKLRLPLYFCWGAIDDEPRVLIPRVLKETHLYPDHREIAHLRQLPGRVAYSPWGWREEARVYFSSPAEFNSTPTEAALPLLSHQLRPSNHPPSHRWSATAGRKRVKTCTRSSLVAPNGTRNGREVKGPDARSSRLAREAHAAEGGPPGKKGARVFVWEEQEGFLIRKSVNRINAADMWDEYTPNQRRYDGFSNEWDLCHEFAPDEDAGADDEGDGYTDPFDSEAGIVQFPDDADTLLPEQDIGQHSTANDLRQMYNLNDLDEQPGSEADLYEPYHDMKEIPPFRFGFTEPVAAANYQGTLRSDMVARSVGDEKWPDLRLPKYSLLPVFLAQLLKAESIQDVPRELLDLRQDQADILEPWAVDVERKFLDQQLFYIVRPNTLPDNKDLRILLQSAATTLQIVRMGWGTLPEIVAELLARGIKFQVCVQAPVYREPVLSQRGTRLGYRPSGYRPTAVDYAAYQHRLDAYLHSSRGRAALCTGGVIGRLAREIVPDALVAIGPSDEVFDTGLRLWDGQGQTAYWDDSLTADEIDLICGVYIVATGLVNSADEDGVQKKEISLWPKPGAFFQSGLNIGWWSPDCERWFQKRSKEIKHMQAELHTQGEWKHKIRYIQKSRQVAAANEKIAAEYLQSL